MNKDFLGQLTSQQREAVEALTGPLLVLAGAGSGKTRVITYRVAHLISRGIPPEQILAVTFTTKAAEEMRKRIHALAGPLSNGVWISTFHSLCARILRVEYKLSGHNANFVIYDEVDQKNVIKECLEELDISSEKFPVGALLEEISRAKDNLLDAESYSMHAVHKEEPFVSKCALVYKCYQKRLESACAFDFGDLILKTVSLFKEQPEILEKYQNRFQFVLVDEYQDTNHAQYMLTHLLTCKHHNICVVGDDDQAIYSFRGANIRNILEFEKDCPGTKTIRLEQNWRSTKNILGCANHVIKHNLGRKGKTLWTTNDTGSPVIYEQMEDETQEARAVAMEILRLVSDEDYNLGDIAVFYRTNAQSRALEEALVREHIAYQIVGTARFYERKEIKDVLAYLKILINPQDNLDMERVLSSPPRGIGKTSQAYLMKYATSVGVSLYDAVVHASDIKGFSKRVVQSCANLSRFFEGLHGEIDSGVGATQITKHVVEKSGIMEHLISNGDYSFKARIENIKELVSAVSDFEQNTGRQGLEDFLEDVSLSSGADEFNMTARTVTLMTVHLAKGLEFPAVFVTGMEEGLFPHYDALYDPQELEEERRLCYVAMTRAKELLYLSSAVRRRLYGQVRINEPSRFVSEAELVGDTSLER